MTKIFIFNDLKLNSKLTHFEFNDILVPLRPFTVPI